LKIKLSLPGQPSPTDLSQFTGNASGVFADCEFYANDGTTEADAWFIFEDVIAEDNFCTVPPEQVHFLSAETSYRDDHYSRPWRRDFLAQFSNVHTCHPIDLPQATFRPPFLPWMVNANHESIFSPHYRDLSFFEGLNELEKDRPLSIFCSDKKFAAQHQLRFDFAEKVQKYFRGDVHWFGNGVESLPEKWDGLARYERTVVLENRSDRNIYSEKILDAFLGLSQPIYWGAPNISSFLPVPESHQIDIRDPKGSLETLHKIMKNPLSNREREALVLGKSRVLNKLHFLKRISVIAKETSSLGLLTQGSNPGKLLRAAKSFVPVDISNPVKREDRVYKFARRLLKGR
jgi:hypothetical protein